jgi:hypothetical protein
MTKVVEKSAEEDKAKQAPPQVEEAEVAEEAPVGDPAPPYVDPFVDRKAQRLAAVQLQVDGPKPEPVTSDVTEDEEEEKNAD